ncbi:MAG: hypothetical protein ACUVQ8_01710 [Nitrososphaeria archaeon]
MKAFGYEFVSYKQRRLIMRVGAFVTRISQFCLKGAASVCFGGRTICQWLLGTLKPGETKSIQMVYSVGESLNELEKNVIQAFEIAVVIK